MHKVLRSSFEVRKCASESSFDGIIKNNLKKNINDRKAHTFLVAKGHPDSYVFLRNERHAKQEAKCAQERDKKIRKVTLNKHHDSKVEKRKHTTSSGNRKNTFTSHLLFPTTKTQSAGS